MSINAKSNHDFAERKHTRKPACISDSKSINSTGIPAVSDFQTALNATESTFVVPILILNAEACHKATWLWVSSPEDLCWLLHLNICRQKEGILHPQGSSKLKIVACKGATTQKPKLCTHSWSQTTLYHHDSKQVSRIALSQKKCSPTKMKRNQILFIV